jgi:indolepyruvate ferredoxin oxidoreductase beta subunit
MKSNHDAYNFVLVGVGGQGTLLASNILTEVGLLAGYDSKKSEVHGMAQRGGSVLSHVRWNKSGVYSPLVGLGEADVLLSFEKMEALRFAEFVRREGTIVVNDMEIVPITISSGSGTYPADEELKSVADGFGAKLIVIPGEKLALEAGTVKTANVVLLGAISTLLPLPEQLWWDCLKQRIPAKFLEINRTAFAAGRAAVSA